MKYCNTCGEVYASRASVCAADGAQLSEWTRTRHRPIDREDSQITSVHGADAGNTSDDEHTNVEILTAIKATGIPRGKHHRHGGGYEVGDDTDIIDTKAHATLTDFDASRGTGTDAGNLVLYDDQVTGPFQGMLVSGRYRLEAQLGAGAFGVVFDAFDKEEERRVAVKLLSPALSDDKRALTRFRREAIAASRIQHPGIVGIYDFGIQDEGMSYIVMEYLAGRDLATLLEEERYVSPHRAAGIILQCALALAAAHDAGVLHRDLKPANVFAVSQADKSEQIKILDFGIAKDRSSNPRNADLTSASKVVGTPYYMAPEQARGQPLDGRADVYSLGVILYELLTATRPFEGATVYEILLAHANAPRVAPSKVRRELTSEKHLDAIVLKAIDSRPENRFASMHALATALESYLGLSAVPAPAHEPRRTHPTPTVAPAPPVSGAITRERATTVSVRKRRLWLAAIPVVLIALFFAVSSSTTKESPAEPENQGASGPVSETPITSAAVPATDAPVAVSKTENEPPKEEPQEAASGEQATPATPAKAVSRKKRRSKKSRASKRPRGGDSKKTGSKGIEEW